MAYFRDGLRICVLCGALALPASCAFDRPVNIAGTSGTMTTIAGNGVGGYSGDGGLAAAAQLYWPSGVAMDSTGVLLIADQVNNVIRRIDAAGVISTVAGSYTAGPGFSGHGAAATSAQLNNSLGGAVDAAGSIYIADSLNERVRKVTGGTISTVAGSGTPGYAGDGGVATFADLLSPHGVAAGASGIVTIADQGNNSVRKVW